LPTSEFIYEFATFVVRYIVVFSLGIFNGLLFVLQGQWNWWTFLPNCHTCSTRVASASGRWFTSVL